MAPPRADAPEAVAVNARGELLPQQRTRLNRRIIAGAVGWLLVLPAIWACTLAWLPFAFAIIRGLRTATVAVGGYRLSVLPLAIPFFSIPLLIGLLFTVLGIRAIESPLGLIRLAGDLLGRRIAWADGTVAWGGKRYAALVPDRARPLRPALPLENIPPGPYRCCYLPNAGWLLSLQRLAAREVTGGHDPLLLALAAANGFRLDALALNRAGRLTPGQARELRRQDRRRRPAGLLIGVAIVAGVTWVAHDGVASFARAGFPLRRLDPGGVAAGLFFLALGLAAIWGGLVGEYRRDLHAGRVAMVEGRGRKVYGSDGDGLRLGYGVGGREFDVSEAGYNALVEGLPYRAYYLPRSGKLVNIEPIAPGGPRATPLRTDGLTARRP